MSAAYGRRRQNRLRGAVALAVSLLSSCAQSSSHSPTPATLEASNAHAGALRLGGSSRADAARFPLVVAPNGRYLQDQAGKPFPILGDAGWEVPWNLGPPDQSAYIADRVNRGFDAVLFSALEHKFTASKPPRDLAGNLPFEKTLGGAPYTASPNGTTSSSGNDAQYPADPYRDVSSQVPDFTYPSEAYWEGMDSYVASCARSGVLAFVFIAYVGYGAGDEGWIDELIANDAIVGAGGFAGQPWADESKSKAWNYGAWIANRYKDAANIVWIHAGDYGNIADHGGLFTREQKKAVNSVLGGSVSVQGQKSTLRTAHFARPSLSTDVSFPAAAFNLQGVYADGAAALLARRAYAYSPTLPTFEVEDYYEYDPKNGRQPNRRFAWWLMSSGMGGYFFGNMYLWPFKNDWRSHLDSKGARDMTRLNSFIRAIPWYKLVPSGLAGMKVLVTAGGGTSDPQSEDYVSAAAASDGTILVAYVPSAHHGEFTVDMSALAGDVRARWFEPSSGRFTDAGTFSNSGRRAFSAPLMLDLFGTDYVLVLERTNT